YGAELAAKLYDKGVPAVLCTRWEQASFDELRKYRPKLPSLLRPDDLDAESLLRSFEAVIRELAGEFAVQRRPWRTQVHVVEVAKQEPTPVFYIDLPSWPEKEIIRLLLSDLPTRMQDILEDDKRLHAMVNLGAETAADLYFIEWEES
ncbi:MAG: hypothetical protein QG608_457, partial [Actinomycetota bacterium]|nr:hypothetical protein [Actinomycetota bacterium]